MRNRRILISGAGIAGPALAYWLLHYGFEPTMVERAPGPRTGGYIIDFWGVGWSVAERMGTLPRLLEDGYRVEEMRFVNDRGVRVGGFDARVLRATSGEQFTSLLRGDLATGTYATPTTPPRGLKAPALPEEATEARARPPEEIGKVAGARPSGCPAPGVSQVECRPCGSVLPDQEPREQASPAG